jgi:glycosyltransferase involved in cell wall biosynthesis
MDQSSDSRKKILFISYMYLDYHMCKVSRFNILEQLSIIGHQTFLYAACINKKDIKESSMNFTQFYSSVPGVQILNFIVYQLKSLFKIPYIIFNNKIDVVICDINSTPSILHLLILKKLRIIDTVFILDFRSNILHSRKNRLQTFLKRIYLKAFIKISSILYDGFTFITDSIKKHIEKVYNVAFKKSTIWSSAVSDNFLAKKRMIKNFKFIILHHGSLERGRGIMRLINAMHLIKPVIMDSVELAIAGNGSLTKAINHESLKNDSHVKFYGQLEENEVINLIDSASICVVPFDNSVANATSSPLKLMEYISRDKIILATQLENFKTNFKDYNGLYFFNTNEPKDIALLIEELIINYNQYLSKKLNNGSEIIRKNYTWSIQAKKIDTFLKTL